MSNPACGPREENSAFWRHPCMTDGPEVSPVAMRMPSHASDRASPALNESETAQWRRRGSAGAHSDGVVHDSASLRASRGVYATGEAARWAGIGGRVVACPIERGVLGGSALAERVVVAARCVSRHSECQCRSRHVGTQRCRKAARHACSVPRVASCVDHRSEQPHDAAPDAFGATVITAVGCH